jgi:hypothetical protein
MARNQEKAQSLLNRWLALTRPEKPKERRPYLASECKSLVEAEKWRNQILKEIGAKVLYIQNGSEFRFLFFNFQKFAQDFLNFVLLIYLLFSGFGRTQNS